MAHLTQSDVDWVIPAMKHMREIITLYQEAQTNTKTTTINHRAGIIGRLQKEKQIIVVVSARLNTYMEKVRAFVKGPETKSFNFFLLKFRLKLKLIFRFYRQRAL